MMPHPFLLFLALVFRALWALSTSLRRVGKVKQCWGVQLSDFHRAENRKLFHAENSVKERFLHYVIAFALQNIKNSKKIPISPWSSMCFIAINTLRLALGITPQQLMRYLRVFNMHFISKATFLPLLLWCSQAPLSDLLIITVLFLCG